MLLDIAVVAHPDRGERAVRLAQEIDAARVVWDEGHGARDTHERAWRALADVNTLTDEHWAMVVEDDALPCHRFRQCLIASLHAAPFPIVSAYLGRGRPVQWQHGIARVMACEEHWLATIAVMNGVGMAVRGDVLGDMVAYLAPPRGHQHAAHKAKRWSEPMDEAMDRYVVRRGIPVGYHHPSLLDHDPTVPSIIGEGRTRATTVRADPLRAADMTDRRAWWCGPRARWDNTVAVLPRP